MSISIHELDTVVLARDVPEANLRAGDLGAVVHVHDAAMIEVEFVTASGRTQAVQTLFIRTASASKSMLNTRRLRLLSESGGREIVSTPLRRRIYSGWPRISSVQKRRSWGTPPNRISTTYAHHPAKTRSHDANESKYMRE